MNKYLRSLAVAGAVAFATVSAPAHAFVTMYGDLATWAGAASTGAYVETTSYGTEFSSITSFSLVGGQTVTMDQAASVRVIGSSWATWCCGYTGQVLYDGTSSQTWSFAPGMKYFGVFAEPNPFAEFTISLITSQGAIGQTVSGESGAKFFGWSGDIDVYSMTVTSSVDFALGDVYAPTAAVPEPETYAMLLAGLGLMGFVARRRQRKLAA